MARSRVIAFVCGVAMTSVACAAVLGIEDITNEPPGGSETGTVGPDGEPIGNDSGTDSASNDTGTDGGSDGGQDVFVPPPTSCVGLPKNCGTASNEDCCTTNLVTGGTFHRSNDAGFPATVPDFRLDKFEVTVQRLRKFVDAYPASKPAANAGAHPNIANSGWDPAFPLPADKAALIAELKCEPPSFTWTDAAGVNEQRAANCLSWYTAFAFCIYDGGFLPTEAEWNYAAAGGAPPNQQRDYPWGNTPLPSTTHVVCGAAGIGITTTGTKSTNGDGKFGQVDLLGNAGEWTLDLSGAYPLPCTNCANVGLGANADRIRRGGDYTDLCNDNELSTAVRRPQPAADRRRDVGVRCARLK